MSQAKVDRYKEEKRNREKLIRKEKREWMAVKAGMAAVAVALVAWVGISVYDGINAPADPSEPLPSYTVNTSALDTFLGELEAE